MSTISCWFGSNFQIPGCSASGGISSRKRSSAPRTSLAASGMFVVRLNSTLTRLRPSSEVEVIRSRLGTLERVFSSGSVMMDSISWGPTLG